MNDREKKLLTALLIAGFLILNFGAVNLFFLPRLKEAKTKVEELDREYEDAQEKLADSHRYDTEIAWLDRVASEPMTPQDAVSRLNSLVTKEAKKWGLEMKDPDLDDPMVDPSLNFHRARMRIEVSGREQAVFTWLNKLDSPDDLRAVTTMRIETRRNDPTQIDCLVEVEQWFLPELNTPPEA